MFKQIFMFQYPATCKELNWLVALLEAYQASDDDIKSLKFNNARFVIPYLSQ